MPRAYRSVRDHLDDVIALVRCIFERERSGPSEALASLELEIAVRREQMEASLALARSAGTPMPLDRVRSAFALEDPELQCLYVLLAHGISEEIRKLSDRDTGTLEMIDRLIYRGFDLRDRFADHLADDGRLLGYGLIETADEHRIRFARSIRISDRIIELAFGRDRATAALDGFATLVEPEAEDLLIPDDARQEVRAALDRHVASGAGAIPVLCGVQGSGRRALLSTIAHELGVPVLAVQLGELRGRAGSVVTTVLREATLAGAMLVLLDADQLVGDPESARPDRMDLLDALARYRGPIGITLGPGCSPARLAIRRGHVLVDLPPLTEFERATLWARCLPPNVAIDAAARYRMTGGQILQAGRGFADRDVSPVLADVHVAVRGTVDDKLTTLGVRIAWKQTWRDLVLPADSRAELDELIARVRHRRRVLDEWGFATKVAKGLGLAALFSGPPGTGKTMAAGLVAADLGLDLYQIDLSRMVSKYIGETEKNLAKVFEAAEVGHAVLLFDEADAMFAKRTEVKSSNDRYANLEVNYLLQRMEAFTGITILTTNHDTSIDDAFRRRLAFQIAFPMPEVDERKRLWRVVIPEDALTASVDFSELAERFVMSGGYIKNAALRAAYLAAADGGLIEMRHLVRAARSEYMAMGKLMTHDEPVRKSSL